MRVRILSRTTGGASVDGPSRTLFYWLIGAFLLTLVPHVTQLPTWLTGSILVAVIVRCLAEWRRWPLPNTTSTGVVALCLLSAIFLQYHTVLGRDAGTPFMAGLLTIKFYELRGSRDVTLIIFSSFFVVMSALLFSQAIELFVYCLIMMWLLTGILLRTSMGDHADFDLLRMLRTSSVFFLQALPLVVLLFFFLPRYSGRFQLQLNDTATGISERVAPGSIAELAEDDSPAMRVTFEGDSIPVPSAMYWRAIVLWHFDHGIWTRGDFAEGPEVTQPAPVGKSDSIEQEIVLWPSNQRWIPALDRPVGPAMDPDNDKACSTALRGDVLVALESQTVDSKRHYTVRSRPITVDSSIDTQRSAATQLPPIDPRVQALANELHAANPETSAYVRAVLHYFQSQHFRLSTSPGRLGADPVAGFLFKTKVGFCEHYASAFAVLMRAAHVPARMVVGYRGGDYNSYGGFYLVSQSNAHAWDEVWNDERHEWMRVDPTTVISAGSSDALTANEGLAAADDGLSIQVAHRRFTLLPGDSMPTWLRHGLHDVAMHREEMEAQWDDWVFSYQPDTQDRLAQSLGFHHNGWLVLLAGCVGVAGTGGAIAIYFLSRTERPSPVENFYAQFCRRMAQRGAPRDAWEGPLAYTERLASWFPEQKEPIEQAGWIVAKHRYAPGESKTSRNLRELLAATSKKS